MQKITCQSCGGVVQKVGDTDYRCTFCGTAYEVGPGDVADVRALLEKNNVRWIYINRRMDEFYGAANGAAHYEAKRAKFWSYLCGVGIFGVGVVVIFALASATMPAEHPQRPELIQALGFAPIIVTAGLILGILTWTFRSMRNAARKQARAIAQDVLANYRQMSDKPGGELLRSLHNRQRFIGGNAESEALQLYDELTAAPQAPRA